MLSEPQTVSALAGQLHCFLQSPKLATLTPPQAAAQALPYVMPLAPQTGACVAGQRQVLASMSWVAA